MWDLPRSGFEPMSPAVTGRFFTTEPPEIPPSGCFKAHYGGRIQNGSEEATWLEEPVDNWELGAEKKQGRWGDRHCLETDFIIRIVRMWWWAGAEGWRREWWSKVCVMGWMVVPWLREKAGFEGKDLQLWHTGLTGTLRYQSRGVRLAGVWAEDKSWDVSVSVSKAMVRSDAQKNEWEEWGPRSPAPR